MGWINYEYEANLKIVEVVSIGYYNWKGEEFKSKI